MYPYKFCFDYFLAKNRLRCFIFHAVNKDKTYLITNLTLKISIGGQPYLTLKIFIGQPNLTLEIFFGQPNLTLEIFIGQPNLIEICQWVGI